MEGEISVRGASRTASTRLGARTRLAGDRHVRHNPAGGTFVDDADFGPHFQAGVVGGWKAVIQGTADFPAKAS